VLPFGVAPNWFFRLLPVIFSSYRTIGDFLRLLFWRLGCLDWLPFLLAAKQSFEDFVTKLELGNELRGTHSRAGEFVDAALRLGRR
jgi:hypothetical protein